jgi:hypothetical protein
MRILIIVSKTLMWVGDKVGMGGYYISHWGIMLENYILSKVWEHK